MVHSYYSLSIPGADDSPPTVVNSHPSLTEEDDPLLIESPGNKENESLMEDDFEKIDDENIAYMEQDHKDQLGDDYDIIGEIGDQHFEVLDSAGETEGDTTNKVVSSSNETSSDKGN